MSRPRPRSNACVTCSCLLPAILVRPQRSPSAPSPAYAGCGPTDRPGAPDEVYRNRPTRRKKPPGLPPAVFPKRVDRFGLAEVELHAEPDDPGADDFQDVVAVGPLETAVALQNGRFVGRVEHVRAHREAEVLQRELLLH